VSKLLVVEFRDRAETNKVLALAELSTSRGSPLYASAVVAKDPVGKTSVQEITDEGLGGMSLGSIVSTSRRARQSPQRSGSSSSRPSRRTKAKKSIWKTPISFRCRPTIGF
jgi:hypothetical protein